MAPEYPAVEIKRVPGKAPEVYWLDAQGNEVGEKTAIQPADTVEDIERIFADMGITRDTPKPNFDVLKIEPTEHCVAWRRHKTDKSRLPDDDQSCAASVPPGGGIGFCECKDGAKIDVVASEERKTFTCEAACAAGALPWMIHNE
eukprot:gene5770-8832_t